jgi:electron-transferring-flavoprotein dehydrogenase
MTLEANDLSERESMEFDVVIVGGGPAGLSAAIRLKQKAPELEVVLLEKGPEIGAHILSGAVIDPIGLDTLLPDWRKEKLPVRTEVTEDRFLLLGEKRALGIPHFMMPPLLSNRGCYIVSLSEICRWLGTKAEALGVQVFPGFAATEALYDDGGSLVGVATADMGISKEGKPKKTFERGIELRARYVLIAEGTRGSLAKQLIERYALDQGREPQKYGLGLKELWRVRKELHRPGLVQHTIGWPLDNRTGGGSFLYHLGEDLVSVGFVVHLNYRNPYLSPFEEFQRFKTHPRIAPTFEGGERLSYGARAISEGGWQSVPKLTFPGGALIGCSAGFVNVPRIKGSHNAMLSGIQAADRVADAIAAGRANDELTAYEDGWRGSVIGRDLRPVRNVKPLWSRLGTLAGIAAGGFDMWTNTLGFSVLGTMSHKGPDYAATVPATQAKPIAYPKPDRVLTFDRASSVFLTNTGHEEDQPVHLVVNDPALQKCSEHDVYGGPSGRYCPAGVYEWVEEKSGPRYVINAINCIHCKTCDIKDPNQNITWKLPEGGGPRYRNM